MRIEYHCLRCILNKAYEIYSEYEKKEEKRVQLIQEVMADLAKEPATSSSTVFYAHMMRIVLKKLGIEDLYAEQKKHDNAMMLEMEEEIAERIAGNADPLLTALKYSFTGNSLDYGAMKTVSKETLFALLEEAEQRQVDEKVYRAWKEDMARANNMVFLTDNCGEVVLDKLLLKQIVKYFPELQVKIIVRGKPTVNDVTEKEAKEVGLDKVAPIYTSGTDVPGMDLVEASSEAVALLRSADIIMAKGMGNFEALSGSGLNIYYLFLCKCDGIAGQFGLPKLKEVFINEKDLKSTIDF